LDSIKQVDSKQSVSHYLIQMLPSPDYSSYTIHFLTETIGNRIVEKYKEERKDMWLKFLKDSLADEFASLSQFRGFVFENVAHQLIRKGGDFTIFGPLGARNEHETTITIPPCTLKIVSDFEISRQDIYYCPASKQQAAYDSWMGNVGFFQVTTAKNHQINLEAMGLGMLKAKSKNCVYNKLYFVIPIERYNSFQRQPTNYSKVTPQKAKRRKMNQKEQVQLESIELTIGELEQYLFVVNWKVI